ncbi:uncharacterized protein LOC134791636 [Cydia splendana]|uniref:uncharacterized protein LOC134791636 n=1 Tax=Cydia splendana TaxID=1100963 RepID=UPI00300D944A
MLWLLSLTAFAVFSAASGAGAGAARLVCYVDGARAEGFSECTHLVYHGDARGDKLDGVLKEYRKDNPRLKIVLRVAEVDKDLRSALKSKHVQGLEIHEAHRSLNKTTVLETVEAARKALNGAGGGPLFLALPSHPELLAKYYDLRTLVKKVDLMMVQTHDLGAMKKMTYHPSRLSGLWDMMNTDSVVDLVVGLGVPASKIVISLPATARQFTLANETLSTPGSPAVDDQPKEIDQAELCRLLQKGRWTLERDQDLSAPYAFKNTTWMSFEDSSSVDVKGKYARVRGLAGLALHKADKDVETPCGPTLKASLAKVLNQQSRAPRAAVLRSLEHEILSAPAHARALDALQVSPYRITQIVDSDGVIHSIREDTRTEFSCSRQGYFVHPRSCARFYRCVKFDQLSPDYTVFEFDCPAGLAFDARYEVCVWPGSLPHSQACPGSSEIAPVPRTRFICPEHEGYYADPENCRWFFACLDHGKAPLSAYEFRCPFGLGFDAEKLKCDWPWLVPACGNIARYEAEAFGYSGAVLTGAAGFHGQTADAVNVAAHNSLISGAALDNLVGIQGGFLSQQDALDANFIASQEFNGASGSNELAYQVNGAAHGNGLVQATKYSDEGKYTSGSLILDDYRLPTQSEAQKIHGHQVNILAGTGAAGFSSGQSSGYSSFSSGQNSQYQSNDYSDNSGAYVHDPSGDYAEPYKHVGSPDVPYVHDDSAYKQSSDYYDYGRYSASSGADSSGQYVHNSGSYADDSSNYRGSYNSGSYSDSGKYQAGIYKESSLSANGYKSDGGSYSADYSGSYTHDDSGKYVAGVYRADGHIGGYNGAVSTGNVLNSQVYHGSYSTANSGNYISDSKAYTGGSHTLAAGSVNVGLVGKTTLVDSGYTDQFNYDASKASTSGSQSFGHNIIHDNQHSGHVSYVSQPAVSINHVGTGSHNLDGYSYVTTPTSSGIPTTATPFAITTAIPTVAYKTTFVPEAPKTSVKQIFGITHPAVTYVQPTVVPVKQYVSSTPKVVITDYNQAADYHQYENKDYSGYQAGNAASVNGESFGYDYSKPAIKFEDGITYSTPAPISVSTYKPQGFSHSQQTLHKVESVGYDYSNASPVTEEPFKKVVAYTTGPSVSTYAEPTAATYTPQSFSHQTIHKVESAKVYSPAVEVGSGYNYVQSGVTYEQPKTVVTYTTPQPALEVQPAVSTHEPQGFSHQTLHKVDASQVNTYSQESSGYHYEKPAVSFEETAKTVAQHVTPAPAIVSTYTPQSYSHQTIHNFDNSKSYAQSEESGYDYTNHGVSYEQPQTVVEYTTAQPALAVSTYEPKGFSLRTLHKVDAGRVNTYSQENAGYIYQKPAVTFEDNAKTIVQHVTPAPAIASTYSPQSYSHQTIHKVENGKSYAQSQESGYDYTDQGISYEQPQPVVEYTTAQPAIAVQPAISTYQPQGFSHETVHNVDTAQVHTYSQHSSSSGYDYQKPAAKFEEAPAIVTYSTPAPAVVSTYKPQSYSHQTIHKVEKVVPVSSTPAPKVELAYQPAVSYYENPIIKYTQKVTPAPYVEPTAAVYTQTYKPISHQHEVSHIVSQPAQYETSHQSYNYNTQSLNLNQGYSYSQPEIQRDVETVTAKSYSDASEVSHQTYHLYNDNTQYKSKDNVVIVSSTPATLAYEEHYAEYEAPKKAYKAPEYIPPKTDYQESYVVSSTAKPIVQEQAVYNQAQNNYDYKSEDYSQQYENVQSYVPAQQVSFTTSHIEQPKKIETNQYSSFQVSYQTPEIQVANKAEEYLPPVVSTVAPVVTSTYRPVTYSTTSREYLPPTPELTYNAPEYLPPKTENTYLPPVTRKTYVKSTTAAPTYKYTESTTYKAPEYLPPLEETAQGLVNFESEGQSFTSKIVYNPYKSVSSEAPIVVSTAAPARQQNIVVATAKSHAYTTSSPAYVSSTYSPTVTSTYAPYKQELVEVTPAPIRRTKPKVAVVTKINDFNPLLVRKLGAVCSCQSPTVVLKGTRPKVQNQDFLDYNNDYDGSSRGDINDNQWAQKSRNIVSNVKTATVAPYVSTTFNPIIVPDDSFYQDLPEQNEYVSVTPKRKEVYVSSTPSFVTSTEKVYTIRPRVKAVTVAPTYKTVLLKQEVAPTAIVKEAIVAGSESGSIESQSFDRYGPGGWRSRDETLQGSVDCQRAGLFRHPKQCNKFYACRWDCTKQRFTLHVFNCPVQLSFDPSLGACNWPSQGPACQGDTLLTNAL